MSDQKPLISVIIDNYNYGRFISDAINSVLMQNFTDYEIIVVDDASTDNSREIIAAYGNRVHAIFLEKNGGQGSAFNAGFAASRGELICLLDADDIFTKDKLTQIALAAAKHPRAILFYNQGYNVGKNFEIIGKAFPIITRKGQLKKKILKTSESLFPPTSFLTFRRDFLQKILPLSPFFTRIDADFPLQMLAGMMGEVAVIRMPLTLYRLHGNNWFSNNDLIRLDIDSIHALMRRTEKWFYYINMRLADFGIMERVDIQKNRFHRRNLFILHELGWWSFLMNTLINPNFSDLIDRAHYLVLGIRRRWQYKARNRDSQLLKST